MSKERKTKHREFQEEIAHLKSIIGIEPVPIEEWEEVLPQHLRDRYASEAFFYAKGDLRHALRRLGIAHDGKQHYRILAERVFGTPGCRQQIEADLADVEANRAPITARMVHVALYGADDQAVRATTILAKMAGWESPTKVQVESTHTTIFQLLGMTPQALPNGQMKTVTEKPPNAIEGFLDHEPGEAVRVSSNDEIDALLEEG